MKLLLSLGSNLGSREENLCKARELLGEFLQITAQSTILETEPWGYSSENKYLNQIIVAECSLDPLELLRKTQEVEKLLGRTTKTVDAEYQDRTIDIDILRYGSLQICLPELVIPHPKMLERDFILKSLLELGEK